MTRHRRGQASRRHLLQGLGALALLPAAAGAARAADGPPPDILFNLAQDSRERANLAEREPQRLAALRAEWEAWNATMLPVPAEARTYAPTPKVQADRPPPPTP